MCMCWCFVFTEKEPPVLRKVLLEDGVLSAMASVIGTATTHLSPE
jgi:DNA repair/transcription protein MET18/MMS19